MEREKKIEVINFGVSGYGTARELLMFRYKVKKYSPDMVILAFLTGNDIRDNSKELNRVDYIPYFVIDRDGNLVLDKSYLSFQRKGIRGLFSLSWFRWIYNHSRLLQLMNHVRQIMKHRSPLGNGMDPGLDNMVYIPPHDAKWKRAWKVTERLLLQLNKEVKDSGAEFLVVTLSNGIQVHPDQNVREKFKRAWKINDLFYPDKRIQKFCHENGIEMIMLSPFLARIASEQKIYMHGFPNTQMGSGHWNANGHRYAAQIISDYLCKKN